MKYVLKTNDSQVLTVLIFLNLGIGQSLLVYKTAIMQESIA